LFSLLSLLFDVVDVVVSSAGVVLASSSSSSTYSTSSNNGVKLQEHRRRKDARSSERRRQIVGKDDRQEASTKVVQDGVHIITVVQDGQKLPSTGTAALYRPQRRNVSATTFGTGWNRPTQSLHCRRGRVLYGAPYMILVPHISLGEQVPRQKKADRRSTQKNELCDSLTKELAECHKPDG
jgi:hypothetical protein